MSTWARRQILAVATHDTARTNARAIFHSSGSTGLTVVVTCDVAFSFRVLYLPLHITDTEDTASAVEVQAFDDEGVDFAAGTVVRTLLGNFGRYFVEVTPAEEGESWVDINELGA